MTFKKPDNISAPTQPIEYQSASPEPSELGAVLGQTKAAIVGTVKVIGAGVILIGLFALKLCLGDKDEDKKGFDPDPLWRQGYGFNNPNNERIKNGQPALNFDGRVAD